MDYKEMIKLRALEVELNKQRHLAWKRINKYIKEGKSIDNIEYEVLCEIKNFYANSAEDINQKFNFLDKKF
jgi:hypothetical protein